MEKLKGANDFESFLRGIGINPEEDSFYNDICTSDPYSIDVKFNKGVFTPQMRDNESGLCLEINVFYIVQNERSDPDAAGPARYPTTTSEKLKYFIPYDRIQSE